MDKEGEEKKEKVVLVLTPLVRKIPDFGAHLYSDCCNNVIICTNLIFFCEKKFRETGKLFSLFLMCHQSVLYSRCFILLSLII